MTLYLALEGPDGCGKSTQAVRLRRWLEQQGHAVLHVREPGSTPLGESLRAMLLDPRTGELSPLAEALLFCAARAELVRGTIAPALRAKTIVVAERCWLSTAVYQGIAAAPAGVSLSLLEDLAAATHDGTFPHRIFVLDVPYEVSAERRQRRDRIEARSRAYHERVRAGYAELAARDQRCVRIDGGASPDEVHEQVVAGVRALLAGDPA